MLDCEQAPHQNNLLTLRPAFGQISLIRPNETGTVAELR